MTLAITTDLITSDRLERYAWRTPVGTWMTSWTVSCFWDTQTEAVALLRFAERVEADGPHPNLTEDEVEYWSDVLDMNPDDLANELRTGRLEDLTVVNGHAAGELYAAFRAA